MRKLTLLCIAGCFITLNVFAGGEEALPGDVQHFIDSADACEYFAGE